MPRHITEVECHALGEANGLKWMGLVDGQTMGAKAYTLWDFARGCGVKRAKQFHNLKGQGIKRCCASVLAVVGDVHGVPSPLPASSGVSSPLPLSTAELGLDPDPSPIPSTTTQSGRVRVDEAQCRAIGEQRGWNWLGLVKGDNMGAHASMVWECANACGAKRHVSFRNFKARGIKHRWTAAVCGANVRDVHESNGEHVVDETSDPEDAPTMLLPSPRGRKATVNESTCHGVECRMISIGWGLHTVKRWAVFQ